MTETTTLTDTGRKASPFGDRAPVYQGTTYMGEDHHERARLPDGSVVLVLEYGGHWGLYRELVAVDYGDNEYARRPAADSQVGVLGAVPPGLPGRTFGRGLVGYYDVTDLALDPDGQTTLPCGGLVECEDGVPVRVLDGCVFTERDPDGEGAECSAGASPEAIQRDLALLGWRVEFGDWGGADGEPDCAASVCDAERIE